MIANSTPTVCLEVLGWKRYSDWFYAPAADIEVLNLKVTRPELEVFLNYEPWREDVGSITKCWVVWTRPRK